VKLTLLTKVISSSYKLALLIHQDMCLVQWQLKYFSLRCRKNGPRLLQNIDVKEHTSWTCASLQTQLTLYFIEYLQPWLQCRLVLSLPRILPIKSFIVFTPYLTHKIRERHGLNESTSLASRNLKNEFRRFVPHIVHNTNQFSTP